MLELDKTRSSVVVVCTEHPWYRELADSPREAWGLAMIHEAVCHPDDRQAYDAYAKALTRRAAR